ncbi:protein FAM32A-like [Lineus longissimus]|uniref:protein FAM32A-like n=1 Tax=Lineus longissimus TaxID=88925 RepID=UPI002B4FB178
MSEYDNVAQGSLKLKGVSDHGIKKKKKKKSKKIEKEKMEKLYSGNDDEQHTTADKKDSGEPELPRRTKAEMAFKRQQEKRQAESLLEKASKTHKERIMEFNGRLDDLTEHFDIPKVSWTK